MTAKFLMAAAGSGILFTHMRAVGQMAGFARAATLSTGQYGDLRVSLVVHAVGGLLLLLAATALSVYKPFGWPPRGRRMKEGAPGPVPESQRGLYLTLGAVCLIRLLLLLHHLAGGGFPHH